LAGTRAVVTFITIFLVDFWVWTFDRDIVEGVFVKVFNPGQNIGGEKLSNTFEGVFGD
jgi:hypothetical protein